MNGGPKLTWGPHDLLTSDFVDVRELRPSSPLRDLAVVLLNEMRDRGRRTVPRYASCVADLIAFIERDGEQAKVADLDVPTLKAYAGYIRRRPRRTGSHRSLSAQTTNLYLIAVRALLKLGSLLDLPVPSPQKVELSRTVQADPDARYLTPDELRRMFVACPDRRARALLELLYATGCRVSEAMALNRDQMELEQADDGVAVADEVLVFGKGGRYRRVFLHKSARERMAWYLASRSDGDRALFVTQKKSADGTYRMSVWTAEQIVRDAARRARLVQAVSPHWLRHAAITLWAKHNLRYAQIIAGHLQIATTQRYLGTSDAELKAFFKRQATSDVGADLTGR
jgi:site-specific recombinase XerD